MNLRHLAPSIAGFLSCIFLLPGCTKEKPNQIELTNLYQQTKSSNTNLISDGDFIQMTDETILFFHPSVKQKMRSVLAKETGSSDAVFQIFNGQTNKSEIKDLNISERHGILTIGNWSAKNTELDRLEISPEFSRLYKFCASLLPGPTKLTSGIIGSSFVRLNGSKFLITGGEYVGRETKASESVSSTATIYDTSTEKVLTTFSLRQPHSHHLTLKLPDGQILLVGGLRRPVPLEIIGTNMNSSRLLSCQSEILQSRFNATALLDQHGKCILLGGVNSKVRGRADGTVEMIDLNNQTVSRLPNLRYDRCFITENPSYRVSQNAVLMADHSILISGGYATIGSPLNYRRRTDAEIYTGNK